jgi:hypothetical protein
MPVNARSNSSTLAGARGGAPGVPGGGPGASVGMRTHWVYLGEGWGGVGMEGKGGWWGDIMVARLVHIKVEMEVRRSY